MSWLTSTAQKPSAQRSRLLWAAQPYHAEIQAKMTTIQNLVCSNVFCSWDHNKPGSAAGSHQLMDSWTSLSCCQARGRPQHGQHHINNREPNHSQSMNGANSWFLVSILKHWSKVVSVGGLIHWLFYFYKPLNSKNLGKLKTWGEGQGRWRKQRLSCLWVWTLLLIQCVTHWHQGGLNVLLVPLAAGGRNYLIQHVEVCVQPLAFFTRVQIYY